MYKKLKLLTLILLSLSVYFIYNKENKNNLIYITIGDSLSLGENSYGGINYGYSDYFKDYLKKENKLPNTRIWSLNTSWNNPIKNIQSDIKSQVIIDLKEALDIYRVDGTSDPDNLSVQILYDF